MSIEIVDAEAGTPSPFLTIVPSKDTSYSFSCEQIEKLTKYIRNYPQHVVVRLESR